MRLRNNVYELHAGPEHPEGLHPDMAALCAVLAFHPAMPAEPFELRFDFPVSARLLAAFKLPYIVPQALISTTGEPEPYRPARAEVLSYGGGLDSLAAHALLPEVHLVHQAPMPHQGNHYFDIVPELMVQLGSRHSVALDNMRNLFDVWGLPLWVSVYAPSLVLQPAFILSGSELTGTYLEGGKRYFPRHRNLWYRVFEAAGVRILPTSFVSEVANSRIAYRSGKASMAAYCALIKNQDCGACSKCVRRRSLRAMNAPQEQTLLDEFKRSDGVDAFLAKRPLYYGDVFAHALSRLPRRSWIHDLVDDVLVKQIDTSFHERYYAQAFDDFAFPAAIRNELESALVAHGIEAMTEDDVSKLKTYVQ